MSVVAIIPSRLCSQSFSPSLSNLCGTPVLARILQRISRAHTIDQVVVAASTSAVDDPIVAFCQDHNWTVHRGAECDLLERCYRTGEKLGAEAIVRISPNAPFVDPALIDQAVEDLFTGDYDFVSNAVEPCTFPRGLEVEAFTFRSFARLRRESDLPIWRQQITTGYYRQREKYRLLRMSHDENLSHLRWSLETAEDLEFAQVVFDYFGHDDFPWTAVLPVLAKRPHWSQINSPVRKQAV